jgi:hypothetical protein
MGSLDKHDFLAHSFWFLFKKKKKKAGELSINEMREDKMTVFCHQPGILMSRDTRQRK